MDYRYSILTYIFGGYEKLHEIPNPQEDVEYICVTDDDSMTSPTWKIVVDHDLDGLPPINKTYSVRYNVWKYVSSDICVRMDGSISLRSTLDPLITTFDGNGFDCALIVHPARCDFRDEFDKWIELRNYKPEQKVKCMEYMSSHGYDFDYKGMNEQCFAVQRKNDVNLKIDELTLGLLRELGDDGDMERIDQIIVSYVIQHLIGEDNISCLFLSEQLIMDNSMLAWCNHNSDEVIKSYHPSYKFREGYFFNKLQSLMYVYAKPRTMIFTYTHKDFKPLSDTKELYTIITGSDLADTYPLPVIKIEEMDKVAAKRDSYGELMAAYHVWKHPELIIDKDYVGIQHYSRWWNITGEWQPEGIFECLGFECIAPAFNNEMPISTYSHQLHYHKQLDELDFCLNYIWLNYPEYQTTIEKHLLKPDTAFWCNMLILRKDYFLHYCRFVFDVIEAMNDHFGLHTKEDFEAYHEAHKMNNYNEGDMYYKRLNGYIGEVLTSLFIRHNFGRIILMDLIDNK